MGGMWYKVVVSVISIVLVVGIVIGVLLAFQREERDHEKHEKLPSMKMVTSLCGPATFKDACIKSLGPVSQNHSATPRDYVEAGVKFALQEISKGFNLTHTLLPNSKYPNSTQAAINSCNNYFRLSLVRLQEVFRYAQHPDTFDSPFLVWYIRLSLTDVITFTTACVDDFSQVHSSEMGGLVKDGLNHGRELTFNMLDIITVFHKVLASVNVTQLAEAIGAAFATAGKSRQLLGFPMNEEGLPGWFPGVDRHLLIGSRDVNEIGHYNQRKMMQEQTNSMGGTVAKEVGGAVAAVGTAPAVAPGEKPPPDAVVAQDGSGQYKSIMDAVKAHPGDKLLGRWVIYVKAGTYREEVHIDPPYVNILMYGDGPTDTIITGDKNCFIQRIPTDQTAPFHVEAPGFFAKDMGFQNTAGPEGHQAVALRINAAFAVFHNCWFDGYQDTLFVQSGTHFFRDCEIRGTIDFIFGDGATLIQNSNIVVKKGNSTMTRILAVTAQGGEDPNDNTAIVIHGSQILPDADLARAKDEFDAFLGRPWKPYCKTIIMETEIGDFIKGQGYEMWKNHHLTAFYGEYNNFGPGANTAARVTWPNVKVLSKLDVQRYTLDGGFFQQGETWVKDTGVPTNLHLV